MDSNKKEIELWLSSSEKTVKNNYSIYLYLKEHPVVFIACISAFVAVITFALNAIVYIRIYKQLQYWGLSAANIPIDISNQIYIVFAALIYSIVCTLSQLFMTPSFTVFSKHRQFILNQKYINKLNIEELKRNKRIMVKQMKIFKFLNCPDQMLLVEIEQAQKDTVMSIDEISDLIIANKKAYNNTRSISKYQFKQLFKSIFIPILVLLLFIIFYIYVLVDVNLSITEKVLIATISLLINVLLPYIFTLFESNREQKIAIRKAIQNGEFPKKVIFANRADLQTKYPIEKLLNINIHTLFSNKNVALIIWQTPLMLMAALISCFLISTSSPRMQKSFHVCEIDDTSYVVIYEYNNTYYLAESEIINDSITINTLKKRVVVSDDFEYRVIKFETVDRILIGDKE